MAVVCTETSWKHKTGMAGNWFWARRTMFKTYPTSIKIQPTCGSPDHFFPHEISRRTDPSQSKQRLRTKQTAKLAHSEMDEFQERSCTVSISALPLAEPSIRPSPYDMLHLVQNLNRTSQKHPSWTKNPPKTPKIENAHCSSQIFVIASTQDPARGHFPNINI
jgi:hypothetical protein